MAWYYATSNSTSTTTPSSLYWLDRPNWIDSTGGTCDNTFWPRWQDTTDTVSNITATTTSNPNTIYWPVWHENIVAPAIIRERSRTETARLAGMRRQEEEEAEKRKTANERARQILLEHLTPAQRETIEKNGWFTIEGGKSGKIYRIKAGAVAGNIEELDKKGEKAIARYCCHLPHLYPAHDHHLTQKLMLEWDEETFLKRANKTNLAA